MKYLLNFTEKAKTSVAGVSIIIAIFLISASFTQQQPKWKAPELARNVKNPIPSGAACLVAGKAIYIKECLECHGKKGLGDGPNSSTLDKAPAPLNKPDVKLQTDGELFWKIKEGKKPMPSTKKILTDDQRWQVVNYIRTFSK